MTHNARSRPMPTYEYVCAACNNEWEEVQKISEPALEVCPKCAKPTAKRQISGGNFILKGGGWYADLYSSTKAKGGEKAAEGKSEGAGSASAPAKADSGGAASGGGAAQGGGSSSSSGSGSSSSGGGASGGGASGGSSSSSGSGTPTSK